MPIFAVFFYSLVHKGWKEKRIKIITRCPKAIYGHRYPCPASDFCMCDLLCEQGSGPGGDRRGKCSVW